MSSSHLKFQEACQQKQQIHNLSYILQQSLMYMQYKIRKQSKSFTLLLICGARSSESFKVDKAFQKAFSAMNNQQKIQYFCETVNIIRETQSYQNSILQENFDEDNICLQIVLINGQKNSQPIKIRIQTFKILSEGTSDINLDMRNYLIRKSKKKNISCYVLQAIKKTDPQIIRFSFLNSLQQNQYYPLILKRFQLCKKFNIIKSQSQAKKRKQIMEGTANTKQNFFKVKVQNNHLSINDTPQILDSNRHIYRRQDTNRTNISKKSICQQMMKNLDEQDLSEDDQHQYNQRISQIQNQQKVLFTQRLFKSMVPHYNLPDLDSLLNFGSIYESQLSEMFVYRNHKTHKIHKMQAKFSINAEIICKALYNVQLQKYWHPIIQQGQVTMKITSQNSCLIYLKQKPYSEWYRPRDYLLLLHLFRIQNNTILVGKSVQNIRYPPFQSITRGKIDYVIWKIQQISEKSSRLSVEIVINHQGGLNKKHQQQLTLRYLKGFEFLQTFLLKQSNILKLQQFLNYKWIVSENINQESVMVKKLSQKQKNPLLVSLHTVDFEQGSQISIGQSQFYSIDNMSEYSQQQQKQSQESQHQLNQSNIVNHQKKMLLNSQVFGAQKGKQIIDITDDGTIMLPKIFLKKKHIMDPFKTQKKIVKFPYTNIVLKNDWALDKSGGLKLINPEKIQAQRNVSKFVMKTMKKNLFSGKSVLSISLPVQIFNSDSNLQRICSSFALGPEILQRASQTQKPLERFKLCLEFGFSTNIFFFDLDKPFNPILGQTYQGFIRGCPIYAQQISHHPPISSVYFVGRGYKVYGSLEGKVSMGMNSGQGVNQGFVTIQFDDGNKILYQAQPAQISGLNMGDIKYNFKGKSCYIDLNNRLLCQVKLQESGGYFSKKKRDFSDQISGQIYEVKQDFIRNYINNKTSPTSKQIIATHAQLSGRWPLCLKIDDIIHYDVQKNLPEQLQDDIYPLPSNSNYREDLFYRKLDNISKSQLQKQRLQGIQRNDKKLRSKNDGKSH